MKVQIVGNLMGWQNMQRIAIIMAMQSEAEALIEHLDLRKQNQVFRAGVPFEFYQGGTATRHLALVVSGTDPDFQVDNVATVPAALMTETQFMENLERVTTNLHVKTIELLQLLQKVKGDELADKRAPLGGAPTEVSV